MARLVFRNGPYSGKSLQLPPGKSVTLGRSREIELPLPDLKLSRKHCQIVPIEEPEGYVLKDMGSTNGTYLNGQRVQGEQALHHFDRLLLGDTEIEFQYPESLEKIKSTAGKAIEDADTDPGAPDPEKLESAAAHANEIPISDFPVLIEEPAPASAQASEGMVIDGEVDLGLEAPEVPAASTNATEPKIFLTPATPAGSGLIIHPAAAQSGSKRGFLNADDGAAAPMPPPDHFTTALMELDRPLPPEPAHVNHNPQVLFCDQCDVSIPELDYEIGFAHEGEGKLLCRECHERSLAVARAVAHAPSARAITPIPAQPLPQPQTPAAMSKPKPAKKEIDVDALLKGLDEAEPELVVEHVPKWKLKPSSGAPAVPVPAPHKRPSSAVVPTIPPKPPAPPPNGGPHV